MKNLKLFVAPLVGAALLTACGAKPIPVAEFKTKVETNFKLDTIKQNYVGKKLHVTGTDVSGAVDKTGEIVDAAIPTFGGVYYTFRFKDAGFKPTTHNYYILSTKLIDFIEEQKSTIAGMTVTVNYFNPGNTYTVERITEGQGSKTTEKFTYNSDLVITSSELNASASGQSINTHLDFKYE